ncbi:MAG TPA: hypothetical protein VHR16_03095 [Candidatus Limnocylindrales bacterium]|nr:hypothetical protein [Candidatus Limnocylindrales bacterium]
MTASELAFLALGLLLGAATGAASFVLIGARLPKREIRVTVTRDALPRRSETLSQAAFVTSAGEPARGGPADRRWHARDDAAPAPTGTEAAPSATPTTTGEPRREDAGSQPRDRTIVPIGPGRPPFGTPAPARPAPRITTTVPIGSAATAIAIEEDAERELEQTRHRRAWGSALERLLRGEHRAMVEVLDTVAGADSDRRREWEVLLGGLVEAMADIAVEESVIDFPMGTAFWDSFTVEQCRRVMGALSSMGFRYDGHDGWMESRAPAYRDLSQALADVGVDPRRMRAWPNSAEIANLLVGARPAPEELLAAAGPAYRVEHVRELVGERADALADLWLAWDSVRPALLEEHLTET